MVVLPPQLQFYPFMRHKPQKSSECFLDTGRQSRLSTYSRSKHSIEHSKLFHNMYCRLNRLTFQRPDSRLSANQYFQGCHKTEKSRSFIVKRDGSASVKYSGSSQSEKTSSFNCSHKAEYCKIFKISASTKYPFVCRIQSFWSVGRTGKGTFDVSLICISIPSPSVV